MSMPHADARDSIGAQEPGQPERERAGLRLWWLFPAAGLLSLVWFLVRVLPKPSRAAYPCQRAAAPLAGGFVLWLTGVVGSVFAYGSARELARRSRRGLAGGCLAVAVAVGLLAMVTMPDRPVWADNPVPNSPIGVARGICPGRVVWAHNADATDWLGLGHGHWWESTHTDQAIVDAMLSGVIRQLTGKPTDAEAWDALFRHFNQTHGRGEVGYAAGDKVGIKVNLVGCIASSGAVDPTSYDLVGKVDYMNTSPQVMLALLRQLVYAAGVNQADISIGDPICLFPNQYYDVCHAEFPNVHYLDRNGGNANHPRTRALPSSVPFYWSIRPAGKTQDTIPLPYAEAAYFINLANLKSHSAAGVTLCGKNYYGFLNRTPVEGGYYNMHDSLPGFVPAPDRYRALVDLMGHAHTGGKALLYLIDGLYAGVHPTEESPRKWYMAPFNGDWTSSLLASQDPVAIDSVAFDFLWAEWSTYPHMSGADDYLHEAALANNPPSGIFYDPDHGSGVTRLSSLGTHEHWNNAQDRQYSRNLGSGNGIELISPGWPVARIQAHPTSGRRPLTVDFDGSGSSDVDGTIVLYEWDFDNDGTVDAGGVAARHEYDRVGDYVARLTVTDDDELTATATVAIAIERQAGDSNGDYDVDLEDFGHLQACLTGPGQGRPPGCTDADLDNDVDVDGQDVSIFQRCMSGADVIADPRCAE